MKKPSKKKLKNRVVALKCWEKAQNLGILSTKTVFYLIRPDRTKFQSYYFEKVICRCFSLCVFMNTIIVYELCEVSDTIKCLNIEERISIVSELTQLSPQNSATELMQPVPSLSKEHSGRRSSVLSVTFNINLDHGVDKPSPHNSSFPTISFLQA